MFLQHKASGNGKYKFKILSKQKTIRSLSFYPADNVMYLKCPQVMKSASQTQPERTRVIKNTISSCKWRPRRKRRPWVISSWLWFWLWLDRPEMSQPQLALAPHRASWHLCKIEPSGQVWEPEEPGRPSWSVVLRPLPRASFWISLTISPWRQPWEEDAPPSKLAQTRHSAYTWLRWIFLGFAEKNPGKFF